MSARTSLYNLFLQPKYCLLCFPNPSRKLIYFLLNYFGLDEKLLEIALVFQDNANVYISS